MHAQAFLQLIDHLYAAPGSVDGWHTFLDRLRAALHGSTANLIRHDARSRRGDMLVTSGADPEGTVQYLERWSQLDPWAYSPRQASVAHQSVTFGEQLIAHTDLQRTAFYNDFARHFDLVRIIGGVVESGSGGSSVLSISRSERQAAFDRRDAQLLEALVPHIRRAVALHQRLIASDAAVATFMDVVNASSTAMLFVGARGELTFVNEAGSRLLAAADGLVSDRSELRASDATDSSRLRQAIGDVAQALTRGNSPEAVAIGRPSGRRPLAALVFPVTHRATWGAPDLTVAIIVVSDPERHPVPDASVLRMIFGFTPSEIALARLLARGLSLTEAAEDLRLTRETVRSRLKTIFEKSGTHRQAELVRLLLQYALDCRTTE